MPMLLDNELIKYICSYPIKKVMKKLLFLLLTFVFTFNSYSQITFEKGYFINNSDEKIICFIKNIDWVNNPTSFEYKLSEDKKPQNIDIKLVKEFGINNFSKYIRETVEIDRSSDKINKLSDVRNPVFKEEQLFLKVIIEGKASLYLYSQGKLKRYFFNKDKSKIKQLVYKKYIVSTIENKTGENNYFKQQLASNLKCSKTQIKSLDNLYYRKNSLVNFFTEYNICKEANYVNFTKIKKRDLYNINLRPRINNSSLSIVSQLNDYFDTDFGNSFNFGFGVELEFILSFNKNKWAFFLEPTYLNFNSKNTRNNNKVSGGIQIAKIDYTSITIPVGLRHYLFLNKIQKFLLTLLISLILILILQLTFLEMTVLN